MSVLEKDLTLNSMVFDDKIRKKKTTIEMMYSLYKH